MYTRTCNSSPVSLYHAAALAASGVEGAAQTGSVVLLLPVEFAATAQAPLAFARGAALSPTAPEPRASPPMLPLKLALEPRALSQSVPRSVLTV